MVADKPVTSAATQPSMRKTGEGNWFVIRTVTNPIPAPIKTHPNVRRCSEVIGSHHQYD
jgi:hypothetical protein